MCKDTKIFTVGFVVGFGVCGYLWNKLNEEKITKQIAGAIDEFLYGENDNPVGWKIEPEIKSKCNCTCKKEVRK